jgi:uncharacterized repeat protein (TIGR03943 family)
MSSSPRFSLLTLTPWLDVLAGAAWGIAFLKFWLAGQLVLLIHPRFIPITVAAGIALLAISLVRGYFVWLASQRSVNVPAMQHLSLLPPGVGSLLLLSVAILGLFVQPRPFTAELANNQGEVDVIPAVQVQKQAFGGKSRSEDLSLVDWIRRLDVYPEPDAYTGQKVKVKGFVKYPSDLPDKYFEITRFVLMCCAADARAKSLPVKVENGDRKAYPVDSWLEIEGEMITEQLLGERRLTILAKSLKPIPEPKNPYDY